jgi:2-polyprenyl-3-methyl-5-hydroxy-6-metoxy-1,4-benzoquinol methylase
MAIRRKIKLILKKIFESFGFKVLNVKHYQKLQDQYKLNKSNRFALNTGERQVAKNIDGIRNDHVVRYQMVSDFLVKNISITNELFGADIFCGNGYGSYIITQKTNCFTFGVDASSEAISLANEYYADKKMFFTTKLFPFHLPKNIFDFIVSFETIEHIVDDKELISEFTGSLKKGGYIFLSAPNESICSFSKNNYKFHVKHYTFDDVIKLLPESEFELITWYGNSAYDFKDGVFVANRKSKDMIMKNKILDAHLTYVFRKK